MMRSHFGNIRVVLAEPNMKLRTDLKSSLLDFGFKHVQVTGNLSQIVAAVKSGNADLVIADTALPEGDFNEYVHELRHGLHGDNPFLVVITLISETSKKEVQAAIDSGADYVLAKPIVESDLMAAIAALTQGRKRFVVTSDYIGPDRRSLSRKRGQQIPQIDVPNPLLPRMAGNGARSRRSIQAAIHTVNEQKVIRHAFQVGWLMDHVMGEMAAIKSGTLTGKPEHIVRLCAVSKDLCQRLKGTRFAHIEEIILTLCRMAGEGLKGKLCERDMKLMGRMAEIIANAFDPDRDSHAAQYSRKAGAGVNVFQSAQGKTDETDKTDKTSPATSPPSLARDRASVDANELAVN